MLASVGDKRHLAHSFYYDGKDSAKYLLFLYKDALPKGEFLDAWNELDDNSFQITIVPEPSYEQAIDDFTAAFLPEKLDDAIEIYEVEDFAEMQDLIDGELKANKELMFFAVRK